MQNTGRVVGLSTHQAKLLRLNDGWSVSPQKGDGDAARARTGEVELHGNRKEMGQLTPRFRLGRGSDWLPDREEARIQV